VKAITMIKGKAVIDTEKCVGCRLCVVVCSYGAPR
jgi:Fe-S-cluster-containing hydrogenase component 2